MGWKAHSEAFTSFGNLLAICLNKVLIALTE